jgi:hypothetical protein
MPLLKRVVTGVLIELLIALSVLYVGDWAVWRFRMARGSGMGSVSVETIIVTPLKGNKEEYDWGGTSEVDCSRSIFPRGDSGACWWLQIHRTIYER